MLKIEIYNIIKDILKKYQINISIKEIIKRYSESHRYYHTIEHIDFLIKKIINNENLSENDKEILIITSIFHDIIYIVGNHDNEEQSAKFMIDNCSNITENINIAYNIILDTKNHKPRTYLSKIFCEFDMDNLMYGSFSDLIENENKIFKEFSQHYTIKEYVNGRINFLKNIIKSPYGIHNKENIEKYILFIKNKYINI